ncbi:prolyl 4-hydroxylase subunit alpha-1-like [Argopecten irradians]|uniref:prolyl 4-hydroxylase subunit alpha-1-like n=1 Tax=Argopecten irradians TaxID=31199 RepID=UPI003716F43E
MENRKILKGIFLVLALLHCVNSQAFSSIRNLEIIYTQEGKLLEALRDFVNRSTAVGSSVSENITSFMNSVAEYRSRVQDVEQWVGNPINALNFIERMVVKWEKVIASIRCENCGESHAVQDFIRQWTAAKSISNYWPTLLDIQEIYKSILRLWKFYDLSLLDILDGKIGTSQGDPLTTTQVLEMRKHSKFANRAYNSVLMIQALHDRRKENHTNADDSISDLDLDLELATAYADFRYTDKVLEIMEKYENSDSRLVQLRYNVLVRRAYGIPIQHRRTELKPPKRNWDKGRLEHKRLCNEQTEMIVVQSSLKCLYRSTKVKYYTVKEEVVHRDPHISIFHGLISDKEMTQLREWADDKLKQSVTSEEDRQWAKHRVSQSAWKGDNDDTLAKLNQRIHLATGLNIGHSNGNSLFNQYEIINYGLGGMYQMHYEVRTKINPRELDSDAEESVKLKVRTDIDKLATWMFHLSSAEGGATVFPNIGVRVPATKGTAVFVINMDHTGDVDGRLITAECPVILGSKWTAKKWISYERNYDFFLQDP